MELLDYLLFREVVEDGMGSCLSDPLVSVSKPEYYGPEILNSHSAKGLTAFHPDQRTVALGQPFNKDQLSVRTEGKNGFNCEFPELGG